ncbi:ATP-binding protein [Halalkalibacter alkalisediminis]|uniref:histidine kinase n=2 Tax=Halalkalibacter alkalisediminis TaxID=935616 RepID=A0ABV6NMX7_9BACI
MSLRLKIVIMSFVVVVVSVMTSGWIMVNNITDAFEKEIEERAVAIARTVAQMPDIREHVGRQGGETKIQPVAENIRTAANVDYIVIIDMNSIRYSHPSEELIGKAFVGGDEQEALAKKEYVSRAQGTLGNAIRAFVPILTEDRDEQVGVAVVGILAPTFHSIVADYSNDLLFSLLWGLFIGLVGSFLLAHHIKKQTFGLEPYEIAKLAEERSAVMQAMDIGIIAVDEEGQITFMNSLARQYIQGGNEKESLHVKDIFPNSWERLVQQLNQERMEQLINQNVVLFGKTYLLSLYPIEVKGKLVGTLLTMVDRTEANRLAEELTGVKALVDALRAQNHEYMNKLHSIAGLIQLERTDEALDVILDETENEESMILFLKERFTDYSLSGLLLGKRSRARELGITLSIDPASYLKGTYHSAGDLVTITGNLIENAFEAFGPQAKSRMVDCFIQGDDSHLYIKVKDNGKGISPSDKENIFTYGFSSKAKEGRGIGLALVQQIVMAHHGEVKVESELNNGTEITIKITRRGTEHD